MAINPILDPILGKMRTVDPGVTAMEKRIKTIEDQNLNTRVTNLEAAVGTFNTQAMAIIGESEE